MVTALAPNKRVDLAVKAFNELGLPLKIVGSGSSEDEKRLRSMAKENIEFLGNKDRSEIIELYAKAKAFIFPGVEDFGITPLESLASGTPLVAFKHGGILETQTSQTAVFFSRPTAKDLEKSVKNLPEFSSETLYGQASLFSKSTFINKIQNEVQELLKKG